MCAELAGDLGTFLTLLVGLSPLSPLCLPLPPGDAFVLDVVRAGERWPLLLPFLPLVLFDFDDFAAGELTGFCAAGTTAAFGTGLAAPLMPFEADAYDIFGFGAAGAASVAVVVVEGGVETGFDAGSLGLAGDAGAPRTTSAAERTPRTTSAALGLPPRTMSAAVIFGAGDDDADVVVVVVDGFVSTGFVSLVGVAGVAAGAGDDGTGLLSCDKPASRSNAALSNDLSAEKSVLFTAVFTASLSPID